MNRFISLSQCVTKTKIKSFSVQISHVVFTLLLLTSKFSIKFSFGPSLMSTYTKFNQDWSYTCCIQKVSQTNWCDVNHKILSISLVNAIVVRQCDRRNGSTEQSEAKCSVQTSRRLAAIYKRRAHRGACRQFSSCLFVKVFGLHSILGRYRCLCAPVVRPARVVVPKWLRGAAVGRMQ